MKYLEPIFKNDIALYIYLFLTISLGWYYGQLGKHYTNKYDINVLIFIETIVLLIGISLLLAHKHHKTPHLLKRKILNIDIKDYALLIAFAVYGFSITYIGLNFLQHHDFSKIRISEFIISIPISAFGLYYFSTQKLTNEKILGLILVVIGGYLFMK